MKIIQLTAENVKRLVAVEIKPDGNIVQITGKNGHGKSSVLDSIWWALSGAKHIQSAPIRKGANQARIKLDMGDIVVTRTFKRDKEGDGFTTKLEVVGAVKGSPQAMLDSLLDSLAFDPLAFARMDPKAQFETLRRYVPNLDFDKIAALNSIDFSNRADKNKRAKEERILADKIVIPDGWATERVDDSALVTQLAEAGKHNADIQMRAENRRRLGEDIEAKYAEVARLRQQAEDLMQRAATIEAEAKSLSNKLDTAPALPQPINVDELQVKIAAAKVANQQVIMRTEKEAHERAATTFETQAKELTRQMEQREEWKRTALAEAKLPVDGITFGDGIVVLNGVPFEQASDAEQLKASCALAMAGNPQLRVIRVRDGSLLDEESLALLAKMAEERDYQVWIERVGAGKVGFILEDGHLLEREKTEPETVGVQ